MWLFIVAMLFASPPAFAANPFADAGAATLRRAARSADIVVYLDPSRNPDETFSTFSALVGGGLRGDYALAVDSKYFDESCAWQLSAKPPAGRPARVFGLDDRVSLNLSVLLLTYFRGQLAHDRRVEYDAAPAVGDVVAVDREMTEFHGRATDILRRTKTEESMRALFWEMLREPPPFSPAAAEVIRFLKNHITDPVRVTHILDTVIDPRPPFDEPIFDSLREINFELLRVHRRRLLRGAYGSEFQLNDVRRAALAEIPENLASPLAPEAMRRGYAELVENWRSELFARRLAGIYLEAALAGEPQNLRVVLLPNVLGAFAWLRGWARELGVDLPIRFVPPPNFVRVD